MKFRFFILLLVSCGMWFGCKRAPQIPQDSFELTVQRVMEDANQKISILKIRVPASAWISVECDGSKSSVALPELKQGEVREGQVVLSATRIMPEKEPSAYFQSLIRPMSSTGYGGGHRIESLPKELTLEHFFSIQIGNGTNKLDMPITIGSRQGKPIKLVVGKQLK